MEETDDMDDEIDLDEILKEMGYGDKEVSEEVSEEEEVVEETNELEEVKSELTEAMDTIKELKSTINEVNLLNAKLLYTNKLFRSYELNNDQKMKVVETLDRTKNVREVKLVFSTLAESLKIGGTAKKVKQAKINESFASKPVASTAPTKEVITESTNTMADRFKKLANI
jgi:dGTP triphosphohydrolase